MKKMRNKDCGDTAYGSTWGSAVNPLTRIHRAYIDLCQIFVYFCLIFRRCASDEWKGCFQWAEGTFLKSGSGASNGWKDRRGLPYTELVDTGDYKITGLHPVFCALDF